MELASQVIKANATLDWFKTNGIKHYLQASQVNRGVTKNMLQVMLKFEPYFNTLILYELHR